MNLHDQLKLYKHGFSKVTDHATREIRHGRLTREAALALVRDYEQAPVEYSELFNEWLGVSPRSMQFLLNQHRNQQFWRETSPGQWQFNGCSILQKLNLDPIIGDGTSKCTFTPNAVMDDRDAPGYITVGKGYP